MKTVLVQMAGYEKLKGTKDNLENFDRVLSRDCGGLIVI